MEPITNLLGIIFGTICFIYVGYKYITMPFEIQDKCQAIYKQYESIDYNKYEYSYGRVFNNKYSCLIKVIPIDLDQTPFSIDVTLDGDKGFLNTHKQDRSERYYENSTSMFNPLYFFEIKK